jgi:antitoxin component YwqK of YwqJK toxin-antitoxin module
MILKLNFQLLFTFNMYIDKTIKMVFIYNKFFLILGIIILFFLTSSVVWSETMDDLVYRGDYPNDLYYKKFSDIPFTGKIDKGLSRGSFKNGRRDGQWIGYHENGQLLYKGNYKSGKEVGTWVYHYDNGNLLQRSEHKLGNYHGLFSTFYSDAKIKSERNYKNGKRHGLWTVYSPDGNVIQKGEFKNDKREGFWLDINQQGNIDKKFTGTYKDGKKISD